MPRTGTDKVIGFKMASQRPIDEHYLNEGVQWESIEAALVGIPLISRSQGKQVNIAGVIYKFTANLEGLELAFQSNSQAENISIADSGDKFESGNVEGALFELITKYGELESLFNTFKENNFAVNNYTIYNGDTNSVQFICVDPSAPIIPIVGGVAVLKNAEIIQITRDTQPQKLTDYGFEPTTGLITLSTPLFVDEALYVIYKKAILVQS
jgi:hypothetical protein